MKAGRRRIADRGATRGGSGRRGAAVTGIDMLAALLAIALLGGCAPEREASSDLRGRVEATASVDRTDVALPRFRTRFFDPRFFFVGGFSTSAAVSAGSQR